MEATDFPETSLSYTEDPTGLNDLDVQIRIKSIKKRKARKVYCTKDY